MRTLTVVSLMAVSALGLAGCGNALPTGAPRGRAFLSTEITEKGQPRALVPGTRIRLTFDDKGLIAYAGCNTMQGPVQVEGDRFVVKDLATTAMACEPAAMAQDDWLRKFLTNRPVWRLTGDELVLTAGDTEIRFTDRETTEPDRKLFDTRWVVDTVLAGSAASSVPKGTEAHLTFGPDGTVTGHTGCNSLTGHYRVDGTKITFSELVSTRMACDDDRGRLEQEVLAVLDGAVEYRVEGDRLTLTHPSGKGLSLKTG